MSDVLKSAGTVCVPGQHQHDQNLTLRHCYLDILDIAVGLLRKRIFPPHDIQWLNCLSLAFMNIIQPS